VTWYLEMIGIYVVAAYLLWPRLSQFTALILRWAQRWERNYEHRHARRLVTVDDRFSDVAKVIDGRWSHRRRVSR